jgi:hypothetical protein
VQPFWWVTLLLSVILSGVVSWIVASITTASKRRVDEEIRALDAYVVALEVARNATQKAVNSRETRLDDGVGAINAQDALCRTIETLLQRLPPTSRDRAKAFGESVRRGLDAPEGSDIEEAIVEMQESESIEAEIRSVEGDRARLIGH